MECGVSGKYLCVSCVKKVGLSKPKCLYCRKASIDGNTHVKCIRKFGMDGLYCVFEYKGIVRKAILGLKYKYATEVVKELSNYLIYIIRKRDLRYPKKAVLTPIPLHILRENWRGFNQSELMGKYLSEVLGWDYSDDLIVRSKLKSPQTLLNINQRKENIKGVFKVNPNNMKKIQRYRCVVLFDDVYTTGSTMKEAASILKKVGVEKVYGLAIAG